MRLCAREGCDRKHKAKGLCSPHYWQMMDAIRKPILYATRPHKSTGVARAKRASRDPVLRFWMNVALTADPTRCWIWQGAINVNGYGQGCLWTKDRIRLRPTHRIAFYLSTGITPKGMTICHSCDTPLCVNPRHLFSGTPADNMRDMVAKRRSLFGERHHRAKLTEDGVRDIRRRLNAGEKSAAIAKEYGVSRYTIYSVKAEITWAFVS